MSRIRRLAWVSLVAVSSRTAVAQGSAQAGGNPFAAGIQAYQNLDFDQAAMVLRRELARPTAATAPVAERVQGLVYLGAADLYRGRRDSALAVFRRLVRLDPRYRPDSKLFPSTVTSVFDSVRVEARAVALTMPPDTEFSTKTGTYAFWVVASGFQTVEVTLRYQDGAPFRTLYLGPMGDSLRVQWDGRDAAGEVPPVNRVLMRVMTRAPTGELVGMVHVPLELRIVRPDTIAWPQPLADSLFLPERSTGGPAARALLGGALLGGAVAALPAVVGGQPPSGPRIAVMGTVGIAAALGYVLHRPGRPLGTNIRANADHRTRWQQQLATVQRENQRRREDVHLGVRAGEATVTSTRVR